MAERLRRALPATIGLIFFLMALEVLHVELRTVRWSELRADIVRMPRVQLAQAMVLTLVNYGALTGYDGLALAYAGRALPYARIALTSLVAFAVSNNVGLAMLSGASVRYRFYSRWGVTPRQLSRIVFSYTVTFWLGLLGLGGLSLVVLGWGSPEGLRYGSPGSIDALRYASPAVMAAGWLLMLAPLAYVATTVVRRRPLRVRRFEVPLPSPLIAAAQLMLSAVEWSLAGAVLYVLMPPGAPTFLQFIGIFLVAILLGMASHVPGGVGVFEGLMVLLMKPYLSSAQILPALVVYRAVYYLLPLSVALVVLVADEVHQRRTQAARVGVVLGRLTEQFTPRVLAIGTFVAGVVLLFSGATPAAAGRLALLDRVLPLGVIEASHFLASVAGAGLLVLSQGLARRLDGAYYLAAILMIFGITASMLKGIDYEEAALLMIVLVVLRRARPAFDRRAAFFETRFSPGWVATVIGAVGSSVWLGLFAFKQVAYSSQLWWQFELQGDASRFLRASVGAAVVLALVGFARLIGPAPHEAPTPTDDDIRDAAKAIACQTSTLPYLALLRDKALLFDDERTAFVMYGVQGRTWVALGDPVGPEDRLSGLVRLFLERCDDFGGVPVFYEVGRHHLHRYSDFGLTVVKLGEEAKVDLKRFTLAGSCAARYRQVVRRLEKDGGVFRVVDAADVPAIMDQLRAVSDDWVQSKTGGEKGFSLGFFDESYIAQFPAAVIERGGRIQAFANLWPGARQTELSIDLMRYDRSAPRDVMEALLVHVMEWGKAQGYERFALGMAPLSGFEQSPVSSLWNRVGSFLYQHGASVYNFQGLRAYKQKFNPCWEPRYLAYPGGPRLPLILADVSALIAGGYRRILLK
jgi:phosphatidylglycerol lysyltransferase